MKNTLLVGSAILFLAIMTLAGCLWVPIDDGDRRGDHYERDRGEHRGDRHDNRRERR